MENIIPVKIKDCVTEYEYYHFSDFEKLYDKYAGAFYRMILSSINDTEVANKILENTFCFVFKNINDHDSSRCSLFIWMKNILQSQINIYSEKK